MYRNHCCMHFSCNSPNADTECCGAQQNNSFNRHDVLLILQSFDVFSWPVAVVARFRPKRTYVECTRNWFSGFWKARIRFERRLSIHKSWRKLEAHRAIQEACGATSSPTTACGCPMLCAIPAYRHGRKRRPNSRPSHASHQVFGVSSFASACLALSNAGSSASDCI